MKAAITFLLAASPLLMGQPVVSSEARAQELDRVAKATTAMVDGDVCLHIQTKRSREFLQKNDPRDPWIASDNFDVDHAAFIQTKKTLMRLARLCPEACDANLWMPVVANPPRIQVLIRNVYEMSSFWTWGDLHQPMPEEMKRVLATGERVTFRGKRGMISVLAPVYDSLNNIVAVVEVVSQEKRDLQENVK
jgi:hypothetical protein